jgi:hypothetical protein
MKLSYEFGWFKGEDFCLIDFNLLNICDEEFIQIFKIKISKFVTGIALEK